jgi:ubiquinone biosynthesis protein
MLMGGTINDPKMQLAALRDLGALPPDTDLDVVIRDLGLDQPVKDPTAMSPEELLGEIREIIKKLLAYGARFPKVLMLYVKDLLFIDGALATLAPDIDLFEEVTRLAVYFTQRYGEKIAADVGVDPREHAVDLDGMRAQLGVTADVEKMSYRDLQARRELIRKRMEDHRRKR